MGYGGRRLGGFTHKEAEATIPDTAMIWFDEEGEGSPSYAPFSVLKTLVGTALAPTAPAYAPENPMYEQPAAEGQNPVYQEPPQ